MITCPFLGHTSLGCYARNMAEQAVGYAFLTWLCIIFYVHVSMALVSGIEGLLPGTSELLFLKLYALACLGLLILH